MKKVKKRRFNDGIEIDTEAGLNIIYERRGDVCGRLTSYRRHPGIDKRLATGPLVAVKAVGDWSTNDSHL